MRLRINSRSNSAKPPRTVSINLPCAVVVSAQVSRSDMDPAPLSATTPISFRRSLVDRASRSRRPKTPRWRASADETVVDQIKASPDREADGSADPSQQELHSKERDWLIY